MDGRPGCFTQVFVREQRAAVVWGGKAQTGELHGCSVVGMLFGSAGGLVFVVFGLWREDHRPWFNGQKRGGRDML